MTRWRRAAWLTVRSCTERSATGTDSSFREVARGMSDDVVIFHNPSCSKSRQTLGILEDHGVEPEVVLYKQAPPDRATLEKIVTTSTSSRRSWCAATPSSRKPASPRPTSRPPSR